MSQKIAQRTAQPNRLGVLVATHAVNDFYQGAIPAILPFLMVGRGYGYAAASGIVLAGTFLSSLTQPLFGVLADHRRRHWLIGVGMLVAALGVGVSGLVDDYVFTWCAVALSGIGAAAYHPEAARLAGALAGGAARRMSWFSVGGTIGAAAAAPVVALVLAHTGLPGTAILAVPALVMAVHLLTGPFGGSRTGTPAVVAAPSTRGNDWRAFRRLTGVVAVRSIIAYGILSFLALLLISRFQVGEAFAATAIFACTGTGVAATLLGGWLADRIGRVRTVRIGLVLCLPGLVGLLLAQNLATALAAAVLLGIGVFIPFAVDVTLGQEYLPGRVGTASGITLGLSVSVGGIATPALGLLADLNGLSAAFVVLAALPLLGLVCSIGLPEPRKDAPHDRVHLPR